VSKAQSGQGAAHHRQARASTQRPAEKQLTQRTAYSTIERAPVLPPLRWLPLDPPLRLQVEHAHVPLSGRRLTSRRRAGRAAVLDEGNAVLLQSGIEPGRVGEPGFWILPGGGAMAGESLDEAVHREIYEETGARLGDLGPVVWERHVSFPFDGRHFEQHESIFVVRAERFEVKPVALTELELRFTTGSRWWPLKELAGTKETVYPPLLASLIADWLASGPPPAPLLID
jgi:8-oxo-dGTP pyrophosphatase MutT (NUDIX family)